MVLHEVLAEGTGPGSDVLHRWEADKWAPKETAGESNHAVPTNARKITSFHDFVVWHYHRGFHADWRDYYPGVNLEALLHVARNEEAQRVLASIVPVVQFAVTCRLEQDPEDSWKHATLMALAVLGDEEHAAWDLVDDALASVREDFQPRTTANNIRMLAAAVEPDGAGWRHDVAAALVLSFGA